MDARGVRGSNGRDERRRERVANRLDLPCLLTLDFSSVLHFFTAEDGEGEGCIGTEAGLEA